MIEICSGGSIATIDPERGGRLASLAIDGRALIVGPLADDDRTILWGSFLMAPWCGRIGGAVLDWEGSRHHLPAAAEGNAIHGVVWDQAWSVDTAEPAIAILTARLETGGWPFAGLVRQRFELRANELVTTAELLAKEPMPAALGWHPWFLRTDVDPRLTVDGEQTLETRGLLPTGRCQPVDDTTDLRHGPEIGARRLDHCYPDVRSPALVDWPDLAFAIDFDPSPSAVVVHTRASSFCIEPQTAWPDAVALEASGVRGTGLVRLAAGERLAASMTWRWNWH